MTIIGENYIRFDWAMKRLLRNKANHAVLEGFLSSLIGKKFKIQRFLESESNQEDETDKYNRVDILAENENGELCIIEVQNNRELTYFHRMLYGVSKAITEYIGLGSPYDKVRKVYSINIVYFELGQGKDYVYHGKTEFRGAHEPHDILKLSVRQNKKFFGIDERSLMSRKEAGDLFPEYYILRVNDFDKVATTPLDEWRECLRVDSLSDQDKRAYVRHMESIRHMKSIFDTSHYEGYEEGIEEGRAEGRAQGIAEGRAEGRAQGIAEGRAEGELEKSLEIARNLLSLGIPVSQVLKATGLTQEQINKI